MKISIICKSNELRSFLSQQNISLPNLSDPKSTSPSSSSSSNNNNSNVTLFPGQSLVRSFYRSVTSGIDEIFTGPVSMMDTIIQSLLFQQSQLTSDSGGGKTGLVQDEDLVGGTKGTSAAGGGGGAGEEGLTYFTKPICDFFVTLFELKENNNWLRRQAILIILQQILGGTIER